MGIDFGKQIGPLPLGAWGIVVVGGLGIAYWTKKNNVAPTIVEDGSGTPGVGVGGGQGAFTPTQPSGGGGVAPEVQITNNEQWAVAAINWLIAQNYPPSTSDSAIRKYISGIKLGVAETALVNLALGHFGSPPQPLPPIDDGGEQPPPTQPPPTQPPPVTPTKKYEHVSEGQLVDPWIAAINKAYGLSLNDAKLLLLNPTLWGPQLITWSKAGVGYVPAGTPGAVRTFGSNQTIRVV